MKFKLLLLTFSLIFALPGSGNATNLLQVYDDAQQSDPEYQQIISAQMASKEGYYISLAALLPNISLSANPSISRVGNSGSLLNTTNDGTPISPRNNTSRTYTLNLSARQTIFDFAKFTNLSMALADSKGATATINSALQDLMVRVSKSYFAILEDEENLEYTRAAKRAFAEQLKLARHQHQVGLKTKTDVYTAQASYETALAEEIAAQNKLANDKENLWAITGKHYKSLKRLSEKFPLVSPKPTSVDTWVKQAQQNNWNIKTQQYAVIKAREEIKHQYAGHMPTIDFQADLRRLYDNNITARNNIDEPKGAGTQSSRQIMFNIGLPLFEGGGVVAKTQQANYSFQAAEQKLEKVIRQTLNTTRQSYLNIILGISKLKADKESIKSNINSVKGLEAAYQAGTETLVNVLTQQKNLFQSQTQYAKDRYAFVNDILVLKQASGSLSFDDLKLVNRWLTNDKVKTYQFNPRLAKIKKKQKLLAKLKPDTKAKNKKYVAKIKHKNKAKTKKQLAKSSSIKQPEKSRQKIA